MTISSTTFRQIYTGDGSNKTFAIPFAYPGTPYTLATSEVQVYTRDEGTTPATESLKAYTTDYVITGTNVVFGTAPLTGIKVMVRRRVPLTQLLDLLVNGSPAPDDQESSYDRAIMAIQQINEETSRAIKFAKTSSTSGIDAPEPLANCALVWSSDATQLLNGPTTTQIANAQTYATNAQTSATNAAASASAASTSASAASTSATAAASSATAAAASATAAAASAAMPLGGDLSGTIAAATVATVGTSTAANIHSAELAANAATAANTVSTIMKRDGSGQVAASTFTGNLTGNVTGNVTGSVTGNVTGNVTGSSGSCTGNAATVTTNANLTGDVTSVGNATTYNNALPAGKGGTGATASSSTPAASANVLWDANSNLSANNLIDGFTTTALAGGTTTMTISSAGVQVWTGSGTTAQTVKLPTTGVAAGVSYLIANTTAGTGAITVQSSGANTIATVPAGYQCVFTAQVATPTTAANWSFSLSTINNSSPPTGTVTSVACSVPSGLAVSGTPVTTSGTLAITASGQFAASQIPAFSGDFTTSAGSTAATAAAAQANITSLTSATGVLINGLTATTPGAGKVGEEINAYVTTAFAITTSAAQTVTGSSITLTAGVWLVSAIIKSDNDVTQTGFDGYIYIKGANSGLQPKDQISMRYSAGTIAEAVFIPRIVIVASGDADKTVLLKASMATANGHVFTHTEAVRIA